MDKILAFSILSSSPADISATGFVSTRFSWRRTSSSNGTQHQQQAEKAAPRQQEKKAGEQNPGSRRPAAAAADPKQARFAPEFDGINCFESIVSF